MSEILIPDLDFTLVGFQDLAQSFGKMGHHDDPEVRAAQAEARRLCTERGIAYMVVPASPDQFGASIDDGAQILLYGATMGFVRAAVETAAQRLASLTSGPSVAENPVPSVRR